MPPLVLLPGMNCTDDLWTECDLGGVITPKLDQDSVAAQVDRLLADLPPVFVLGGLSLGAIVALSVALRAPDRVAGLCVMSVNAKAPTPAQRAGWRSWLARLDDGDSPRALQHDILPELLTPGSLRTRPDLVERTLAMADATGVATVRSQLRMQLTRVDLRAGLREVVAPTLIVSGAMDAVCPPSFHAEIAAEVAHSEIVSVDGGHLLPLERPQTIGALIREWATASR